MDLLDGLSVAQYEALPEDICRRIEIVDGAIIVNEHDPAEKILSVFCYRLDPTTGSYATGQHHDRPHRTALTFVGKDPD
jgi:hypothetical protein